MINVLLRGKAYNVLKAEADARGITAVALGRAILTNIVMTDDVDYAVEGIDLANFGKPPVKKAKPRGKAKLPKFDWNGVPTGLPKIAEIVGIPYSTLYSRISRGWSLEGATSTPVMTRSEAGLLGASARR